MTPNVETFVKFEFQTYFSEEDKMPEFTPEQIQELQTLVTAAMAAALPQAPPGGSPRSDGGSGGGGGGSSRGRRYLPHLSSLLA